MDARFEQIDAQFAEMRTRVDKLHANGLKALQGSISHRNRASFVPSVFPTASFSAGSSESRGPLSGELADREGR